ncbi:hypothetical protein LJR022_009815 [Paraburkholderia hospita]
MVWNRAVDEQAQDLTRGFQVRARFGERVLRRLAGNLPRSLLVVVDEMMKASIRRSLTWRKRWQVASTVFILQEERCRTRESD